MAMNPTDPEAQASTEPEAGLLATARAHPGMTATLVLSVVIGAYAGFEVIPAESYAPARRIVGGGLLGGLSWLLVMVGRII